MDAMDKAYGDWLREQVELLHQAKIRIPGLKEGFEAGWRAAANAEREACAAICDKTWVEPGNMQVQRCHEAAAAIRASNAEQDD